MIRVYFIDDYLYNNWVDDCLYYKEDLPQEFYWEFLDFESKREYNKWLRDIEVYQINYGLVIKKVEVVRQSKG